MSCFPNYRGLITLFLQKEGPFVGDVEVRHTYCLFKSATTIEIVSGLRTQIT